MSGTGSPLLHLALLGVTVSISLLSLSTPSLQDDHHPTNPRLFRAYVALQKWKHCITDDPKNVTATWCGPHVCNYTGVFCAPAPDDPNEQTVAGIDLNHNDLAGTLPEELGLQLADLALFHLNSNRFCGTIPESFREMKLLHELDVSNNRFEGTFPGVLLDIPSLKYLDIRYNKFYGDVPSKLYDIKFDAIFLNNNQFKSSLPDNIGNSPASVIVLANTQIGGCLPRSLGNMAETLNEMIIMNTGIRSCVPPEIGKLKKLTVLDLSYNKLVGPLPEELGHLNKLEQLDVAHNHLTGEIPQSICELPRLKNFTYSYNYFCGAPEMCLKIRRKDDRKNCIPHRPLQRPEEQCMAALTRPVHCSAYGYLPSAPPLLPSPPPHHSPPPPPSPSPSPPPPLYY